MNSETEPLIACEHCGSIFRRHLLQRGESAICVRCGTILWRYCSIRLSSWLALGITTLIVFVIANAYPVISMSVQGITSQASLLDAVSMTWRQGYEATAIMTGLAGFALPLAHLLLLLWVLFPLSMQREPAGFRPVMRLLGLLRPWCMVPVFLLGVLVSVVKLAGMASVSPQPGLFAFGALTVLLTLLSRLSPHALWRYAEEEGVASCETASCAPGQVLAGCHACGQVQPIADPSSEAQPHRADDEDGPPQCSRCDAFVHYRKPASLTRTWALLLAAVALYVPANVLPIMNISSVFLGDTSHTILGGVVELWDGGSWDIALIVFVASIVVPLTKMLALATLAWSVQRRTRFSLRQRTRLYEMIEFIGQWSMLDVFVVILLSALAHFQGLMEISAGPAAGAFGLVVILTMLAAMSFDPRIAWDREMSEESDNLSPPQDTPAGRSGGSAVDSAAGRPQGTGPASTALSMQDPV